MRILSGTLFLLCLGAVWYFVRNDIADYAVFKLLTETADRQRRYRVWVLKSFLLFSGLSVICLAILGRLRALMTIPLEFRVLSDSLHLDSGNRHLLSGNFAIGLLGGIALVAGSLGSLIGVMLARKAAHKSKSLKSKLVLGDIEPMMARNWQESVHTALLSLNAGLSEELFFRLMLPLLVTLLLGNAVFAFVVAALIFGAMHVYQGLVGVVATTVFGFALTVVYLSTGNLWVAVCAHILLNMMGLVIRPTIARLFTAK